MFSLGPGLHSVIPAKLSCDKNHLFSNTAGVLKVTELYYAIIPVYGGPRFAPAPRFMQPAVDGKIKVPISFHVRSQPHLAVQ